NRTAKFDLTLFMWQGPEGLAGSLEYATDLFDPATIDRLLGHFQTLLEGIAADPQQPAAALPLTTAAERRQLLLAWNTTRGQGSGVRGQRSDSRCIHEQFAAQAARRPDAVAVVFDRGQGSGVRGQEDTETRRHG